MGSDSLRRELERALSAHFGRQVVVRDLAILAGGASRKIYSFEALVAGEQAPLSLVARMGAAPGRMSGSGVDELSLLAVAAEAGVRVPRAYCRGEVAEEGGEFYVMERLRGETIARKLLRDPAYERARARLPHDLAQSLARLHCVDTADPRLKSLCAAAGVEKGDAAAAEVARYSELLAAVAGGHPMPVLELVARHLLGRRPPQRATAVVHGDFRIGNVVYDEAGLSGVLDWELAHLGDPMEDLGWLAVRSWRFGVDDKAIGGLCSREEFWSLYEHESGFGVDPDSARYWELFGNWKWAIICILQAAGHAAGGRRDVELAAIGRRVAAVEWEMLELLEGADHAG